MPRERASEAKDQDHRPRPGIALRGRTVGAVTVKSADGPLLDIARKLGERRRRRPATDIESYLQLSFCSLAPASRIHRLSIHRERLILDIVRPLPSWQGGDALRLLRRPSPLLTARK